jgi:hypothetical protein
VGVTVLRLAADGLFARQARTVLFFSHLQHALWYKIANRSYHNGHVQIASTSFCIKGLRGIYD